MSLLFKIIPGITKLSELEIDADKNWEDRAITNMRRLVVKRAEVSERLRIPVGKDMYEAV